MPTSPLLAVIGNQSGTPQVYRIDNGTTPTAIGSALPGASLEPFENDIGFPQNRVIHFKHTYYCALDATIFRYNPITDSWVVAYSFTGTITNANRITGLFEMLDENGDQLLVCVHGCSGVRLVTTKDGSNFTETLLNATSYPVNTRAIVFRNKLFLSQQGGNYRIWIIDPITRTYVETFQHWSGNNVGVGQSEDFCVFQNELYLIHLSGGVDPYVAYISKYTLGGFPIQFALTLEKGPSFTQIGASAPALFTDGTYMYALTPGRNVSNQDHWHLIQLTPDGSGGFTQTDRTSDLPADWKNAGAKSSPVGQVQVWADTDVNTGTYSLHIYLKLDDLLPTPGDGYYYEWPGVGVAWPAAASSVNCTYYLSIPKMGGGSRFYHSSLYTAHLSRTPLPVYNGQRLYFKVSGEYEVSFSHGGLTGTINPGDFVTGASSGATGYVIDIDPANPGTIWIGDVSPSQAFFSSETIYKTVGVDYVIVNTPVAGSATRVVRIYVSDQEELPLNQAQLQGNVTGKSATRVGNNVTQITADTYTEYTVEVDLLTMSIPRGRNIHYQLEVVP